MFIIIFDFRKKNFGTKIQKLMFFFPNNSIIEIYKNKYKVYKIKNKTSKFILRRYNFPIFNNENNIFQHFTNNFSFFASLRPFLRYLFRFRFHPMSYMLSWFLSQCHRHLFPLRCQLSNLFRILKH